MRDDDDPLSRRRAQRQRQTRSRVVILTGLFALVCVGAGITAAVAMRRPSAEPVASSGQPVPVVGGGDPAPRVELPGAKVGKPKADWNHADLAAHLKSRGVEVKVESAGFSLPGMMCSLLVDPAADQKVHANLMSDAQAARDSAASIGSHAVAWNRFVLYPRVSADADLFGRVRAALR